MKPTKFLPRRRFLQIAASFATASALPFPARGEPVATATWEGVALGADARLTLVHTDQLKAEATLKHCRDEINRLEDIFSLYRDHSVLCRLNAKKKYDRPPPELVEVLAAAMNYGSQSDGLFDITIQPLWNLYHQHYQQQNADPNGPPPELIRQMLDLVDYRRIKLSSQAVELEPGMELTLNGIAQGYITDRIALLLHRHGYENALINLGEYHGLGRHPSGRNWRVGIPVPTEPWHIARKLDIPSGKALATSGAHGTRWSSNAHHLLSPITGQSQGDPQMSVTVLADTAMEADALATLLALKPEQSQIEKIMAQHQGASVIETSH